MKIFKNNILAFKVVSVKLILTILVVLPITLFPQENPFIYMEDNNLFHQCEEFYPVTVNYGVTIIKDLQNDYHVSPTIQYCSSNNICFPWFSCGTNVNEWHDEIKEHFEKLVELNINSIRLTGLGVGYNNNYQDLGEVLQTSDIFIQQSSPCYELVDGLVINSDDMFEHQGNLLQEVIDLIKNNSLPLKLVFLLGGGGAEMLSDNYSAYLSYIANRFKDEPVIFAYDLYNEPILYSYPQNPMPDKYQRAEICLQWYNAIKLNAPSHYVTIGSEWFGVFDWDPQILPVDFISFHLYSFMNEGDEYDFELAFEKHKVHLKLMSESFDLPIYIIGETGFPGVNNVSPLHPSVGSEEEQSMFAELSLKYTKWYETKGYSWWMYKDVAFNNNNIPEAKENYFGIIEMDYINGLETPKLAGYVLKDYIPSTECISCTHPDDNIYYHPNPANFTYNALSGIVTKPDGTTPVKNVLIWGIINNYDTAESENSYAITNELGEYELRTSFENCWVPFIRLSYPGMEYIVEQNWNIGLPSIVDITINDLDPSLIPQKPDLETYIIETGKTETWDVVQFLPYKNIIIEEGAQLNITSEIFLLKDAKITVKQNGKMEIDGGRITCSCGLWQGIEVWGNTSEHQFEIEGQCAQGKLILNNAIIENAVSAVELWRPDHWGTQGGIVFADNTIFRNNAKSVHALYYKNYHPYDTVQYKEMDYLSNFKDCTFEITEDYAGEYTFYKHVDLSNVRGIDFQACDFYLADNVEGISEWNSGILSGDAGFRVDSYCNSQQIPCPDTSYVRPYFSGFKHAIFASTDGSTTNSFSIDHAEFVNNACGVKIMRVNNAIILRSDFKIGFNSSGEECEACDGYYNSYGIILDNASGFAIEENEFTKLQGAPGGIYYGIFINNTLAADEVYLNTFDGVSYANFAEGKNWYGIETYKGLAYFCNQNTDNYADFYVAKNDEDIGGIQLNQGNNENVTGNKFSQTDATWHFFNDGNYRIYYYFCDYCANENPDDDKIYQVNEIGKNFCNTCPSHYGGGSSGSEREIVLSPQQKQEAEQEFALNLSDYNSVKAIYDDLTDGGNTNSVLLEIQNAQPGDMLQLRTQLLGYSPHLSMEVLKKVADKTNVFPESVIFEIMAANPDELRKEELIKYLEDKESPLPDYMIDILRQVANDVTYKTLLQQQMSRYNRNKTRAAYDIIRSNLNDTITDFTELRNWLNNIGGIRADEQIIASYIQEGNYTDALSLANMLPALYDMEGEELTEHNYYMDILNLHFNLQQQGRNILELDSTEVAGLVSIAENSNGTAGVQARSILEYGYGYNYFICPNINDTAGYKSSNLNIDDFTHVYGIEITVKPNPAREWTAFNYQLPDDMSKGMIKIIDVYGKLIEIFTINGKQGQKVWDTRHIEPGIYFYTIKVAGLCKSGKIIINK